MMNKIINKVFSLLLCFLLVLSTTSFSYADSNFQNEDNNHITTYDQCIEDNCADSADSVDSVDSVEASNNINNNDKEKIINESNKTNNFDINTNNEKIIQNTYNASNNINISLFEIANQSSNKGTYEIRILSSKIINSIKNIKVATWSENNQSDMRWYTLKKSGEYYSIKISITNHNYNYGLYNNHIYYTNLSNKSVFIGAKNLKLKVPNSNLSATLTNNNTIIKITHSNAYLYGGIASIRFAVWSSDKGQDDLKWYTASLSNNIYSFKVKLTNHKSAGNFNIHAYAYNCKAKLIFMNSMIINTGKPSISSITAKANNTSGSFTININGINSNVEIKSIKVAIWTNNNQSDLRWITCSKVDNSNYKCTEKISNHNYIYSKYNFHAYLYNINNASCFLKSTTCSIVCERELFSLTKSSNEFIIDFVINQYKVPYNISKINVAVWSDNNGQDDLIWYATKPIQGLMMGQANILNHRTSGKYNAHVYGYDSKGKSYFISSKTFTISSISTPTISINENGMYKGEYIVKISNVKSPSGIYKVEVPVWCTSNQSDIHWYTCYKVNNTTYEAKINIHNHKFYECLFNNHIYATAGNGIRQYLGCKTYINDGLNSDSKLPVASISFNNDMKYAWNYLMGKFNNNARGVAGLLGNIYAESGVRANNLQNSFESKFKTNDVDYSNSIETGVYTRDRFIHDSAGYGLAQWTYWSRKQKMFDYIKSRGYRIDSLPGQLEFLVYELKTSYPSVYNTILTSNHIYNSSTSVLRGFEKPAKQDDIVAEKRASYGMAFYNKFYR